MLHMIWSEAESFCDGWSCDTVFATFYVNWNEILSSGVTWWCLPYILH